MGAGPLSRWGFAYPRGVTWTAPAAPRVADAPLVGPERPILEGFLDEQRATLLSICAGLSAEQLALRASPPSNLSLLGLVRHMAKVERIWFRQRVAGEAVGQLYDPALGKDADFDDLQPARAAEDFALFEEECRLAREAAASRGLDATCRHHGQTLSLRAVYVHMIAEYARHNGHADLLRERIDGKT